MPFAKHEGVRIRWEEQGAGEPVLLIHGIGYTLEMWHRVAPVLAERYRVITFDNRGVGESDVPPGPYDYRHMAGDAAAVLDAAGIETAHVHGTSMGGAIAQQLALDHPERLRSLILSGTWCGGETFHFAEPEVYELMVARTRLGREEGIRVMIPYIYDPSTPAERIDEDLAIRLEHYPSPAGYLAQYAAAGDWESASRLGEIAVPALVIHGETDRLINPANGPEIAARIPGARLVTIPGASHLYMTDRPEQANRLVLEFLAEVERAEVPA
jgi:pimeloyl-ACP methyl ester carboxylesterase